MLNSKVKILVIEYDKHLGFSVNDMLKTADYIIDLKKDVNDGLIEFKKGFFNLVLLDIMIPLVDRFTLIEEIRKSKNKTPVIYITYNSMNTGNIWGFRKDIDDYIFKPFYAEELVLKINTVLSRSADKTNLNDKNGTYKFGSFSFDYNSHFLKSPTIERRLTKKEADVLKLLCINKNNILRRDIALKAIWGKDDYFMGRSMDVYITKLRKFLREDPSVSITNIHNVGFMLEVKG